MEVLIALQQTPVQAATWHAVAGRFTEDPDAITRVNGLAGMHRGDDRLVCRAHCAVHDGDDAATGQHARIEHAACAGRVNRLAGRCFQVDTAMAVRPRNGGWIERVQHSRRRRSGQGPHPCRGLGRGRPIADERQRAGDQGADANRAQSDVRQWPDARRQSDAWPSAVAGQSAH